MRERTIKPYQHVIVDEGQDLHEAQWRMLRAAVPEQSNDLFIVVADGSPWEMGQLGALGAVPGWPGEESFPPQPMVSQIRAVLEEYAARGGRADMHVFEGSGHFPPIDAAERWRATFFEFLSSVE